MAAILDFHLQGWDYCWNNDSIVFSVFQKFGMHPKTVFLWQILRNLHDFRYSNRQLVAMAAILNEKISSAGIFLDFSPWY